MLVLWLTWIGTVAVCQTTNAAKVPEAALLERSLSYSCSERQVGDILKQLSDSFDLKFTYINNEIPVSELRSINCEPCPLGELLNQLFPKGNIAYIPILSQILLKAQKIIPVDTNVAKTAPFFNKDSALVDSIEVVVIKRGIVTKRWRQTKYVSLKGKLDLDHFGTLYDYETIYSYVYDTLTFASDTLQSRKKTYTFTDNRSFVTKRHPSKILNGNYLSLSWGMGNAYRVLSGNEVSAESIFGFPPSFRPVLVKQRRDSMEFAKRNYFASLVYQYGIGKHFFARVGIAYTSFGEQGSYYASLVGMSRPRRTGPNPEPPQWVLINDTTLKYQNEYKYFGLPLGLGFTYGKNLGFTFVPSIIVNLLAGKKTSYPQDTYVAVRPRRESPDSTYDFYTDYAYYYKSYLDARKKEYRTIQLSLQLDIELFYKIANRYRVFVAPTFCYGLTSIYKSSEKIAQRPYSYGLKLGLSYLLNPRSTKRYITLER